MKRPFLIAGCFGLIAMLAGSQVSAPLKKEGRFVCPAPFSNPIIALEFISSAEALDTLLGPDDVTADGAFEKAAHDEGESIFPQSVYEKNVSLIRQAQRRDFIFILTYAVFLIAFGRSIRRATPHRLYLLLPLWAICIAAFDILENGAIELLLSRHQQNPVPDLSFDMHRIRLFTWCKWLGLVAYFAMCIPFLWGARLPGRILSIGSAVLAGMALFAWFNRNGIQPFTTAVFLLFPAVVLFCFLYRSPASNPA